MSTPDEALADMRRRVLEGENVPREEIAAAITRLRELRSKATAPKKAAVPKIDLATLWDTPKKEGS